MARIRANSNIGSGGTAKSGSVTISSTSTSIQIDTGLGSGLQRFVGIVELADADWNPSYTGIVGWNTDNSTQGAGTTVYASGAYGEGNMSATSAQLYNRIESVSDGVVTIRTATDSRYAGVGQTLYWFAE